ncbi:MAG: cysteine desulfurase [Bacteroidetes bacterium]|nr:cysteine desulfurase [Bacteroidota bacterium]
MKRIYFDNAATTPLSQEVVDAMLPYMTEHFGNPSSIHAIGRETKNAIEQARKTVAELLNASPSEICFTSGGTESNNTIIKAAIRDLGVKNIVSSEIEHHCVLHAVENAEEKDNVKVYYVKLTENGRVNLEELDKLLKNLQGKTLVSLMHANNELGNLLDIERTSEICRDHGVYFHSDTVQSVAHYKIDLQKTPIHFITASSHKFHGPKGAGMMYINGNLKIEPLFFGGSQERNMRAGTENLYGIVGFGKAIELAYQNLEEDVKHIQGIKSYMIEKLQELNANIEFNGDYNGQCLYTVLNVSFPPNDKNSMLLFNLDIAGISASSGSACSSGSENESHVLQAIKADPERASVRFSFSKYNTKEEVDQVIEKIQELIPVNKDSIAIELN